MTSRRSSTTAGLTRSASHAQETDDSASPAEVSGSSLNHSTKMPPRDDEDSFRCGKCGEMKPRSCFHSWNRGRGFQSYCKDCDRLRNKSRSETARRAWATSEAGKASQRKWQRKAYLASPKKFLAHSAVRYALETDRLVKSPCEICGSRQTEAHHDNYSRPLDVRWLCRRHHADLHTRSRKEDTT